MTVNTVGQVVSLGGPVTTHSVDVIRPAAGHLGIEFLRYTEYTHARRFSVVVGTSHGSTRSVSPFVLTPSFGWQSESIDDCRFEYSLRWFTGRVLQRVAAKRDQSMGNSDMTVFFTSKSPNNPYHSLLFEALEEQGITVRNERLPLVLPLTRTVVQYSDIDVVHLGWLYQFYLVRNFAPFTVLNTFITVARAVWLCLDLVLVKVLGVELVWTVHNKYHHERYYHRTETVLNIIVANLVGAMTVKCEAAKRAITELYRVRSPEKIAVIEDGSYIEAYPNDVCRSDARERLDIQADEFVYLFFGLVRPYKGVERLLNRYRELPEGDSTLYVAGKPENDEIERRVRLGANRDERVRLCLEFVPDEEIQYYMAAADVLVLPYQDILNSGTVYLGLSFGLPIIAPKLGCIPEHLPEEADLLYDAGSDTGLQDALERVRTLDLDAVGEANRRRAEALQWSRSARSYEQTYSELLRD